MAALEKFNPVNFSKNITKTISAVESKIGKISATPKTLTDQLNAKTGLNIAAPPLPQINSNIKSLIDPVKSLVKNPGGVVKSKAKTSFGVAGVTIRNGLGAINATLRIGIKNCIRSAVSSLLNNISTPNIPFGGMTPNTTNGISVNGIITSAGAAGAIDINKKLNKYLNAEIKLLGSLDFKRGTLTTTITGNLNILKSVKSNNYYVGNLTAVTNKDINTVCNTLSPRNKKKLSKGGAIVDMVANVAADKVVNNLENQIVKAASGFSAKSPKDFFNSTTGLPSLSKVSSTTSSTVNNVVSEASSGVARAYNNIKDAINSNVPKQG